MTTATPQPYTVEQIQEIMAETNRLIAKDQRPSQIANARAAATTTKPPTASDVYFAALERHLEAGKTTTEARRLVAVEQRPLLDAYLQEFSASSRAQAASKAAAAARDRRRRNARS